MTVHVPVYRAEELLRIPSEILTKLLVRGENNILAVLSFKSSDGVRKMPPLGPQFSLRRIDVGRGQLCTAMPMLERPRRSLPPAMHRQQRVERSFFDSGHVRRSQTVGFARLMQINALAPIVSIVGQLLPARSFTKRERLMANVAIKWLIVANAIVGSSAYGWAQDVDVGRTEYQSSCAACHGMDAKGNGPLSENLKTKPTDLTVLAKKNNGVFPLNSVYEIIDGRKSISSHGTREMPIWGYRYTPLKLRSAEEYIYLPPANREAFIYTRIMAIIDYLNRVQAK
jgi:mono/diheme cytochrome c family protein